MYICVTTDIEFDITNRHFSSKNKVSTNFQGDELEKGQIFLVVKTLMKITSLRVTK